MHHPCFPTGKVSKVAFFLFQLQLFSTMQCRGRGSGISTGSVFSLSFQQYLQISHKYLTQVFKNSDIPGKTIFERDLQCNFAKAFWQKEAAVQSNRDRIDGTFVFMRDANLGNNAVFGIFIIPLEEDSYRDGDSN